MQQTGGEDETGRRKRREGKKREGGERGREGKVKGQWVTTGAVERLTEARVSDCVCMCVCVCVCVCLCVFVCDREREESDTITDISHIRMRQ